MNIIVPSLALELKVREVAQEVSDTDTFYNLDGTEALVIGSSQIHKIYEDNGATYVLAKSFDDTGWEDVTDEPEGITDVYGVRRVPTEQGWAEQAPVMISMMAWIENGERFERPSDTRVISGLIKRGIAVSTWDEQAVSA